MSKKRRVFDINFDEAEAVVPAGTNKPETRRGPMAAAIAENAEALSEREDAQAVIRSENVALAHELVRLKKEGLITDLIPLDAIVTDKLTRDRKEGRDDDIDELKNSIRELGLSNPIRVERAGDSYELIQGFRRLTAYRELLAETGEDSFAKIPASINAAGDDVRVLYRRMVDENLVRRDVSFGELARLAMSYRAEDPYMDSYDEAVETLFASAGRQKRSYIKSFTRLLVLLDPNLRHIDAVPRALGLGLLKRLEASPAAAQELREALGALSDPSAEDEIALLTRSMSQSAKPASKTAIKNTAKTTFKMARPEGTAKCTASNGRIELRLNRDFSELERQRLEAAVQAFFDTLD